MPDYTQVLFIKVVDQGCTTNGTRDWSRASKRSAGRDGVAAAAMLPGRVRSCCHE